MMGNHEAVRHGWAWVLGVGIWRWGRRLAGLGSLMYRRMMMGKVENKHHPLVLPMAWPMLRPIFCYLICEQCYYR